SARPSIPPVRMPNRDCRQTARHCTFPANVWFPVISREPTSRPGTMLPPPRYGITGYTTSGTSTLQHGSSPTLEPCCDKSRLNAFHSGYKHDEIRFDNCIITRPCCLFRLREYDATTNVTRLDTSTSGEYRCRAHRRPCHGGHGRKIVAQTAAQSQA